MTSVYLECISEKKKLRMRVISDGYRSDLNCTFPKDARVEGAFYAVDHSQVLLRPSSKGKKPFYSVSSKAQFDRVAARPSQESLSAALAQGLVPILSTEDLIALEVKKPVEKVSKKSADKVPKKAKKVSEKSATYDVNHDREE